MVRLPQPAVWTASALILLGAVSIAARVKARQDVSLPRGDGVWRLTYQIAFRSASSGTVVYTALPCTTPHLRVLRETFSHPTSYMYVIPNEQTGGRQAVVTAHDASARCRLIAEFDIRVTRHSDRSAAFSAGDLPRTMGVRHLPPQEEAKANTAVAAGHSSALAGDSLSEEQLLAGIFEYCSRAITPTKENNPSNAVPAFDQRAAGPLDRARTMVALCQASRIPARLVTGFVLDSEGALQPHFWVEANTSGEWVTYDPDSGYGGGLLLQYLPLSRGETAIVTAPENADCQAKFHARRLSPANAIGASREAKLPEILDLTRLPSNVQATLALLLLFPLGALMTTIFRNLIGIQTFGTFTPSLLALSFVHADWRTGLMVLVIVMTIGLAGRGVVSRLKLLTVPRLSVVVTLVVLSLALSMSVLDYYRLTPAAEAVLLPLVIMTMTIERFHISSEEDGLPYALKILAGTLIVGFCCFTVLRLEGLGRLALRFPEGQFFVIAALILIGRYAGYRLTELWRFRDIAQPPPSRNVK